MDPKSPNTNQIGPWTNEKHFNFLSSMEAAFVRTMLEDNGRPLRLDRYMPDSSESTLDLKSQRRKKNSASVEYNIVGRRSRMNGRNYRKTKRLSSQSFDPSEDQVVPGFEKKSVDRNERDHPIPNVGVAPVVPAN